MFVSLFLSLSLEGWLPSASRERKRERARESTRERESVSSTMARDEDYSSASDDEEQQHQQQRAEAGEGNVAVESSSSPPPPSTSSSSSPSSSLKKKKKAASPAPPLRRRSSSSRIAAAEESSLPVVRVLREGAHARFKKQPSSPAPLYLSPSRRRLNSHLSIHLSPLSSHPQHLTGRNRRSGSGSDGSSRSAVPGAQEPQAASSPSASRESAGSAGSDNVAFSFVGRGGDEIFVAICAPQAQACRTDFRDRVQVSLLDLVACFVAAERV